MSEEQKENKPENIVNKTLEESLEQERIIRESVDDLTNNFKYKETFDLYNSDSVKEFIKDYANERSSWLRYGEMYEKIELDRVSKPHEDAENYLGFIIQKKMFNQQCLWRAGEIELEGVESIYDFWAWERDYKRCPFIEPITREEWDVFKKALDSGNFNDAGPLIKEDDFWSRAMFRFQGYDEFKKYYVEHGGENPFPDWYKYYDMYFGTAKLFLLDDLKGPQELNYMHIGHDYQHPEQKSLEEHPEIIVPKKKIVKPQVAAKPAPVVDKRPMIDSDDENILSLMEEFGEEKEVLEFGKYCADALEESMDREMDMNDVTDFLLHVDEVLPIKDCWDWREGLVNLMEEYKDKKKMAAIDPAFDDYRMRIENNIPLETGKQYLTYAKMLRELADAFKRKVLDGRKVLGEPEDFSFNKIKK